jgi:hypothetical protein
MALLAVPPTVTTTLPVVAPLGTEATIAVLPQLVGVAVVPLNLTVLVPWLAPKFAPLIETEVPTGPEAGDRLEILGAEDVVTVKVIPLLAVPPTVTTTIPVVAPLGTEVTIVVALQLDTVAAVPLKVIVLEPWLAPKFAPVMVRGVPTGPELTERLVMLGVGGGGLLDGGRVAPLQPNMPSSKRQRSASRHGAQGRAGEAFEPRAAVRSFMMQLGHGILQLYRHPGARLSIKHA